MGRIGALALLAALAISAALAVWSLALPDPRTEVRSVLEAMGLLRAREEQAWYRKSLQRFREQNGKLAAPCTVLLGDSLVEGFPTEVAARRGWVLRGISGDRVPDVEARLEISVLQTPCEEVVLLAGSNDLVHDRTTPRSVAAALQAVAERLRAEGRRVIVATLPPVRGRYADAGGPIRAVNERLRADATVLLDLHAALADATGRLDSAYSADGLHLTRAGYARWVEALGEFLDDG